MLLCIATRRLLSVSYSSFKTWHTSLLRTYSAAAMSTSTRHPMSPHQPFHWILDWDGTITRHDTLDTLVNISASAKPDFPTEDAWRRVTKAYMDDYTATLKQLKPDGVLPKTVEDERELLKNLKAVEQRSLDRVSSSGIFAGLTATQIAAGTQKAISSQQVDFRPGFANFTQDAQAQQVGSIGHTRSLINVLSVNWSQHFISSCLRASNVSIQSPAILSNEIGDIQHGRASDGHIGPANGTMVISSDDKLRCLERLRQENAVAGDSLPIVYVGDSWPDLECLLAADLGICVRDEPMGSSQRKLADSLERLGVTCPRLRDWREADEWKVVWARDFTEIRDWVARLRCLEQ
ncbi:uncharacterized protein K460DRAFT_366714 [Cucurbitaria berberidis CBS 394.84]|uniref:Haloacid dehalogenase-like hydrolase n=1 Tax=Cucurbitaria berberidis CBS 394.84 TaxID=1168544 RepID=A0A9P4GGV5_9PLEO|nr:uncharacterized protein K460DRAFT_366714 [Cucurbitaria berberidis CBS 394.84]KAF1845863.1 hypothetical protein K460DRAFT_366714 [Cucurbitaria berberidis CBS 394.84]